MERQRKIDEAKSWFSEKGSNIGKPLATANADGYIQTRRQPLSGAQRQTSFHLSQNVGQATPTTREKDTKHIVIKLDVSHEYKFGLILETQSI